MEPPHPNLVRYAFVQTELQLTKFWLTEEGTPGEFEFVRADSPLSKRLAEEGSARAESISKMRLNQEEYDSGFYLSHLPQKGWNHGPDVDRLLKDVRSKRPADLKEQLHAWLKTKVPEDQMRDPKVADTYSRWRSYQPPISDEFKMKAEMLESEWSHGVTSKPQTQRHILNVEVPKV